MEISSYCDLLWRFWLVVIHLLAWCSSKGEQDGSTLCVCGEGGGGGFVCACMFCGCSFKPVKVLKVLGHQVCSHNWSLSALLVDADSACGLQYGRSAAFVILPHNIVDCRL